MCNLPPRQRARSHRTVAMQIGCGGVSSDGCDSGSGSGYGSGNDGGSGRSVVNLSPITDGRFLAIHSTVIHDNVLTAVEICVTAEENHTPAHIHTHTHTHTHTRTHTQTPRV